ncbi:MAG: formate dehydrogenase accessory sulfurtransferase FdhD [Nocardioidaceae bacterium]|nr:formate dehydrogenase accessory sulfurtransferase FdhD [Nocardioidaceae bacterium]
MRPDRRPGPTTRVRVVEWDGDRHVRHDDRLTTEEPLEVRVEQPGLAPERFGITMRTPGHDFELAAGLLLAEGVVADLDDVDTVAYCTDETLRADQEFNVVTVSLRVPARRPVVARAMTATSACGVCGTDSLEAVDALRGDHPVPPAEGLSPDLLRSLPDRLREQQRLFESTGGLHAAGLFGTDGSLRVVREDVGRHNAVDKAIGHCLLGRVPTEGLLLCTSGRLGFEIVQKAAVAGISAVVAVGAPTSLAVDLARHVGMLAAGFVRGSRMVVYTGHDLHPSTSDLGTN